jgi:hypothetical protein
MTDDPEQLRLDSRLRRVYIARDVSEASFVRDLFQEAGLEVVVQGEMLYAGRGPLGFAEGTLPSVWVWEEDVARAGELLADMEARRQRVDVEPWTCLGCGEELARQFEVCWRCKTPRGERREAQPAVPLAGESLDYAQPGQLDPIMDEEVDPEDAAPNHAESKAERSTWRAMVYLIALLAVLWFVIPLLISIASLIAGLLGM